MKEAKMRIMKHMKEINGRMNARESSEPPMSGRTTKSGQLNADFGMSEASRKASSMVTHRQKEMSRASQREAAGEGSLTKPMDRPVISPPDMPIIKNNLYKLDAWLQPFANVKDIH